MNGESRVLVLGGTAEARALADRIGERAIYSLAGRTSSPRLPKSQIRTGPFGGAIGLADFIRTNDVGALIDATHPFADAIPFHAAEACVALGIRRLKMVRSAWRAGAGDRWRSVNGPQAAAQAVDGIERVFLAIGFQDLGAFAFVRNSLFLVRTVEKLGTTALPLAAYRHIAARGPFSLAEERELLTTHLINAIVCRNSGGTSSYAKLQAARELGIEVVMIERPPLPPGDVVETVEDALSWLKR